ncbi:MAG: hypothetical protein RMK29_14755 [Myxococcales bacterium]|nr:hypothetical protein [Myxococcota bacterium]MDW8282973.1 hypothetical protein [Myxococcales bacterium]
MPLPARATVVAAVAALLSGCPKKEQTRAPVSPIRPPEEKASLSPDEGPPADPDPATELAPTTLPTAEQAQPAEAEVECTKPRDCRVRGKPGKGMRWTCFDGRCMAESRAGLQASRGRKKKQQQGE